MLPLLRQFSSFVAVGAIATTAHYAVLIALVEIFAVPAVPAALAGFCAGGTVSYLLSRRHVFRSSSVPHDEAITRFAIVAIVGFGLTYLFMSVLVKEIHLPYLLAQVVTTVITMLWNFAAHKMWTFRSGVPSVKRAEARKS